MNIQGYLNWLINHWYLLALGFLGVVVINLLMKLQKAKVQYHDQIKENKEKLTDVLGFNPSSIKYLIHVDRRYKVLGELWFSFEKNPLLELKEMVQRAFTDKEIKIKQYNLMKEYLENPKRDQQKIAHLFLVTSGFLSSLGMGKKELMLFKNTELNMVKNDTIRINDNVRLMYDSGLKVTTHQDMLGVVTDMTYKLMSDHIINAVGQQQKDFSRIRTDYSHEIDVKEKEAEIELAKKKGRGNVGG